MRARGCAASRSDFPSIHRDYPQQDLTLLPGDTAYVPGILIARARWPAVRA